MPAYKIRFVGRTRGAIGSFYGITAYVFAPSEEAALYKLSDTHESNRIVECIELQPPGGIASDTCPYCGAPYTIAAGGCMAHCPEGERHKALIRDAAEYDEMRDPRDGTMKITMVLTPAYDSAMRFFDACKAASVKLAELGQKALDDGDHTQFAGTTHDVIEDNDDAETVGQIKVSR